MDTQVSLAALAARGRAARLDIFRLLVKAGPEGLPTGKIGNRLGTVQNTASANREVLLQAGLMRAEREGRTGRYAADLTDLRELLAFRMEACCRNDAVAKENGQAGCGCSEKSVAPVVASACCQSVA